MATSHAIVHAAMPTSGHPLTQDYTKTGIGTPKASIIIGARNVGVNTDLDDFMQTFGISTSGLNNSIMGCSYKDNVATTDCKIYQDRDPGAMLITQSTPGFDDQDILADFDSLITDGNRLEFTNTDGSARRLSVVHLAEGIDQVSLDYVTLDGAGTVTVTPGFQADILMAFGNSSAAEPSSNGFGTAIGFYHRVDNAHRITAWTGQNGETTPSVGCSSNDAFITGKASLSGTTMFNTFNAENITSTQYDITNITGSASPQIIIVALKLATGYSAKVGHFNCEVATGLKDVITGLGFQPQIAFLNTVGVTAQDVNSQDNCEFCVGVCDADDEVASGGYMEDLDTVANTDCQQWHREDSCIYIKDDTATLKVKAAFSQFKTTALELNFLTATTGWNLICNYLLIGKDPVGGGGAPLFANHLNQMQRN